MESMGLLITSGTLFVGSVIWLIRLEGRVNSHDREHAAHKDRYDELREDQARQHSDLRSDLAYIRARIDAVLSDRRNQQ